MGRESGRRRNRREVVVRTQCAHTRIVHKRVGVRTRYASSLSVCLCWHVRVQSTAVPARSHLHMPIMCMHASMRMYDT